MRLYSDDIKQGELIPVEYTCDGQNSVPFLKIEDIPEMARSLALLVEDPDTPQGVFTHWIVYNLPPTSAIINCTLPADAAVGLNSMNRPEYVGPCPPSGTHRYFFKLYALDSSLEFIKPPKRDDLLEAMDGHVIEAAELMGTYSK